MTQDERDIQKARVARQLEAAQQELNALLVRSREYADICTDVATALREHPTSLNSVMSSNPRLPSPIAGVSAAEYGSIFNVEAMNQFVRDVSAAQERVREFTERYRMIQ